LCILRVRRSGYVSDSIFAIDMVCWLTKLTDKGHILPVEATRVGVK